VTLDRVSYAGLSFSTAHFSDIEGGVEVTVHELHVIIDNGGSRQCKYCQNFSPLCRMLLCQNPVPFYRRSAPLPFPSQSFDSLFLKMNVFLCPV